MSTCNALQAGGVNILCTKPPSKVKNILIVDADLQFNTLAEIANKKFWTDIVRVNQNGYIFPGISSYAPSTDEPNIATAENTTVKTVTNFPVPSALVYPSVNEADFKEIMEKYNGRDYGIIYIHEDGTVKLDVVDGVYKPLIAEVTAITKGIHEPTDVFNNFPLYINHKNVDAFKRAELFSTLFNINTALTKAMPIGLSMKPIGTYDTGTGIQRVSLFKRGSSVAVTGADAAPYVFSVEDSSYLTSPAVTLVAPVAGMDDQYDLTLDKEVVPVPMVDGETMVIKVKNETATIISEVSNSLPITA